MPMLQTALISRKATILAAVCALSPLSAFGADTISQQKVSHVREVNAFVYPVMGPRMSSDYGIRKHPIRKVRRHHDGIDLAAPVGAPIRAIAQGQVMYADPHGGYGRYIVVKHADGYTSHYGHCDKVEVSPGQRVAAGEILGTVGNSGVSTGPHLHFEIRRNGTPQNPEALLPGLDEQSAG
jgi:murein DD-endopeptidase MepM/ murein hydrolase activator NlpD